MARLSASEKLLVEEITHSAQKTRSILRGLTIGGLIKLIRTQLGMSQKALSLRAGVPQSTVSRIELGIREVNLATLNKVLSSLSCDMMVVPVLRESIDSIRRNQARKIAEKRLRYLKGTMSLEEQQPDSRLMQELLKQEEDRLLQNPGAKLWEE